MIEIYNQEFEPIEGIKYAHNYVKVAENIKTKEWDEVSAYRALILEDLWFIVYFVMKIPGANRPFVVNACQEVEQGPDGWTMDLWFRKGYKSTILTKARTIQRVLKHPEKSTMIASHTRPIAKKFLRPIMLEFETNELLKACFPDVLYENPRAESPKWSEDDGIIVRRKSRSRSEATVEAWGIKEGMPISVHFDWIILDDLETKDDVLNPDVVTKVRNAVDLTTDLLTEGGSISVVGTPYSHEGIYIPYIRDIKKADESPAYFCRIKPATDDGTPKGKSVLLEQEELDDIRAKKGEYSYNCQQMCNPTPVGTRKLESSLLLDIDPQFIPKNVFKFMLIDPAGDSKTGAGDAWAFHVIGIEPKTDDIGASKVFIMDSVISPMRETEAVEDIVRMYLRNGIILQTGIEKVGLSTTEIHVANALREKGRHISLVNKTLVILRPAGRNKEKRIESALAWPLYNGKIYISKSVPSVYRDRLKNEMDKFPFWHEDGLDALSYLYDLIKDYTFMIYDEDDDRPVQQVDLTGMCPSTGY